MATPAPAWRPSWVTVVITIAQVALFAFAFVAAPHGCAWGTDAYLYAAIALLGLSASLPWLLWRRSALRRLGLAAALTFLSLCMAAAGMEFAGLPLLCF
jgi:hypothetical protein